MPRPASSSKSAAWVCLYSSLELSLKWLARNVLIMYFIVFTMFMRMHHLFFSMLLTPYIWITISTNLPLCRSGYSCWVQTVSNVFLTYSTTSPWISLLWKFTKCSISDTSYDTWLLYCVKNLISIPVWKSNSKLPNYHSIWIENADNNTL